MDIIKAICDVDVKSWNVENILIKDSQINITIEISKTTKFKDLHFGVEIKNGNQTIFSQNLPPPGIVYVETSTKLEFVFPLTLNFETEYQLDLWAEEDSNRFEKSLIFKIEKPQKPYESWIWNGAEWQAPVTRPENTGAVWWDEENLKWQEFEQDDKSKF